MADRECVQENVAERQAFVLLAHAARAVKKKGTLVKIEDFFQDVVMVHVHALHKARTQKQFSALSKVVVGWWRLMKENAFADWFEKEYLSEPWGSWYVSVSDCGGVVPNQNPIEAHHKSLKLAAVLSDRASTATVLNETLPRVLVSAGLDSGARSLSFYAAGPIYAEILDKGRTLASSENHRLVFAPRSRKKTVQSILFNSARFVVAAGNPTGLRIDAVSFRIKPNVLLLGVNPRVVQVRAKIFLRSLDGRIAKDPQPDDMVKEFFSMYRVMVKDPKQNVSARAIRLTLLFIVFLYVFVLVCISRLFSCASRSRVFGSNTAANASCTSQLAGCARTLSGQWS